MFIYLRLSRHVFFCAQVTVIENKGFVDFCTLLDLYLMIRVPMQEIKDKKKKKVSIDQGCSFYDPVSISVDFVENSSLFGIFDVTKTKFDLQRI